jgi:hypothetical protein
MGDVADRGVRELGQAAIAEHARVRLVHVCDALSGLDEDAVRSMVEYGAEVAIEHSHRLFFSTLHGPK